MKKKILNNLFPFLKLKDKNLSRLQRASAYVESVLFFVLIFWVIWYIWGYERLFNHTYVYDKLSIHSTYELPNDKVFQLVTRIKKNLNKVNIVLQDLNVTIYISENPLYYYSILYPGFQILYVKSGAFTSGNVIHIKKITLEELNTNVFLSKDKNSTKVRLDTLLSHELIHVWQNKRYGDTLFLNWFKKPKWVLEGYAVYSTEYVDIVDKTEEQINIFLKNNHSLSKHVRSKVAYKLWGLMIQHAIEHMHKSVDDLHLGKVEYDEVMESLLKEYNLSKE